MNDKELQTKEAQVSEDRRGRRDFIKKTAATAVAIVASSTLVETALGQPMKAMKAVKLGDRAMLADGRWHTRAEILSRLGLDPNTPPDAWLCVCGCGSNAAALRGQDAKRLLDSGKIKSEMLSPRQLDMIRGIRRR